MKTLKPSIRTINTSLVKTGSGTQRIRGNSLVAIKKKFERENPRLCATCTSLGLVGFGDEMDHVVPLWMGGSESHSNRQWLCVQHHKVKTAAEADLRMRGGVREGGR